MGCGWLGQPLAQSFVTDDYRVKGSTTSPNKITTLYEIGVNPFLITINENSFDGNISEFLHGIDVLIINIPPKLRGKNKVNYVNKMQLLHKEVRKQAVNKIIFISSTSVYGDLDGEVTEKTNPKPQTAVGKQLLHAEDIFFKDINLQTTIIRFGGLIGPNRHPITRLSKRKELPNGNTLVNLIHLNDCIGIIKTVVANSFYNEIINGVYPYHPSKIKYYSEEAKRRNLQTPDYKKDSRQNKRKIVMKNQVFLKMYEFSTSI